MNDLIDETLAEIIANPTVKFIDLDTQVPPHMRLPADEPCVGMLNDAKDEFEVDGATAVFSTWRVEAEDPLDVSDVEIADGMHARADRMALDASMTDGIAARRLRTLPEGEFILKIKFLREHDEATGSSRQVRPGQSREEDGTMRR